MVAGVDKDVRGTVEASVRQALLGSPSTSGPWSVSVVNLAGRWSVTLDGGRLRGVSFVADSDRLADAIREAVEGRGGEATAPAPAAREARAASPTEARDPHVCEHCGKAVLVVYERQPDEPKELAPLACPHCWKIGHVPVGVWAAAGRDYRAEKG
jgi:DNA-directed RNA polymerase subunit RPC12/RpoP